MELVRFVAPLERRADVVRLSREFTVLFQCSDADTVIAAASLRGEFEDCGVWLEVSGDYPAQMAARDIKTLSTILPLLHVVISSARASEHAEVVRALLSGDEVNFTNDVATIRGAYNRPAPPRKLTVWSYDEVLRSGDEVLHATRVEVTDGGELTFFS
jgi:hypothetical protein